MVPVPEPIRGGTFFYCPWFDNPHPGTFMFCGWQKVGWATGARFRTEKAYRRHFRRHHRGALGMAITGPSS